MPILLTKPFIAGDIAPGVSYTHVELSSISIDRLNKRVVFRYVYGSMISSAFVPATRQPKNESETTFVAENSTRSGLTDYDDIDAKLLTRTSEKIIDGAFRSVHEHTIAKSIFSGTVVK